MNALTKLAYNPHKGTTSMFKEYRLSGRKLKSGLFIEMLKEANVTSRTNISTIDLSRKRNEHESCKTTNCNIISRVIDNR